MLIKTIMNTDESMFGTHKTVMLCYVELTYQFLDLTHEVIHVVVSSFSFFISNNYKNESNHL